jgi:hypothetical protein
MSLGLNRARYPIRVLRSGPRTKMSFVALVSPGTRLEANDAKATKRPSADKRALVLLPFACVPDGPTLTRLVTPAMRSWTKTSWTLFVSRRTRFDALEVNAM